jgi:hypothetical protein
MEKLRDLKGIGRKGDWCRKVCKDRAAGAHKREGMESHADSSEKL